MLGLCCSKMGASPLHLPSLPNLFLLPDLSLVDGGESAVFSSLLPLAHPLPYPPDLLNSSITYLLTSQHPCKPPDLILLPCPEFASNRCFPSPKLVVLRSQVNPKPPLLSDEHLKRQNVIFRDPLADWPSFMEKVQDFPSFSPYLLCDPSEFLCLELLSVLTLNVLLWWRYLVVLMLFNYRWLAWLMEGAWFWPHCSHQFVTSQSLIILCGFHLAKNWLPSPVLPSFTQKLRTFRFSPVVFFVDPFLSYGGYLVVQRWRLSLVAAASEVGGRW